MYRTCRTLRGVLAGVTAALVLMTALGLLARADEEDPGAPPDPLPTTNLKVPKDDDDKEIPPADDKHKVEIELVTPEDGIPVVKVRVKTQTQPSPYNDLHIIAEFHGYNKDQQESDSVAKRVDKKWSDGVPEIYPDDPEKPGEEAEEFRNPIDTDRLWIAYCMVIWTKDGKPKCYRLVSVTPPK